MNIRADFAAPRGAVVPSPLARPPKLAEGFVVPIGVGAAALYFDTPAGADGGPRRRMAVLAEGLPLDCPVASTSVALRAGGRRQVALVGRSAAWLMGRRVEATLGGAPAAILDPDWLQSPVSDVGALAEGLAEGGGQRLLKLFVTTGASLLGRSDFVAPARRLLDLLGVRPVAPLSCCRLGTSARILTYRVPAGYDAKRTGEIVSLSEASLDRAAGRPMVVELAGQRAEGATLLHVFLEGQRPFEGMLLATGVPPLALSLPAADTPPVPLGRWLGGREPNARRWAEALIEATAERDPLCAAILRELRHAGTPPTLAIAHLSETPAGLLHAFRLEDPHGLVREIRVARGGAVAAIPADGSLDGYLPLRRQGVLSDTCRVGLVYASGRVATVARLRPPAFDGAIPAPLAARRAAAAIAAARLDRERPASQARAQHFGEARRAPRLSILCPVPEALDLVRARAALVFAEPDAGRVELVYHVPEGPLAAAAEAALSHATAVFGVSHRLVVCGRGDLPADGLAAALRAAAAPCALILDALALPAAPGWLAPWLRSRAAMVLGRATAHDGGVGGAFDCAGVAVAQIVPLLAATSGYGAAAVFVAELVEALRRRGVRVRNAGAVPFVRYGETAPNSLDFAVDADAFRLILKRSFSFGCDENR